MAKTIIKGEEPIDIDLILHQAIGYALDALEAISMAFGCILRSEAETKEYSKRQGYGYSEGMIESKFQFVEIWSKICKAMQRCPRLRDFQLEFASFKGGQVK